MKKGCVDKSQLVKESRGIESKQCRQTERQSYLCREVRYK